MKKHLLKILGIVILILILRKVDIHLVWTHIRNCNLFLLSLTILVQVVCLVTKVIKWKFILKLLKIRVDFWNSLRAYWSGLYLAAVTPGKVGDISRAYFIYKNNPSVARSIFSVLLDRLTDVASLLFLGFVASFFYLKELNQLSYLLLFLLAGLVLGIWIILIKRDFFYELFKSSIYKFISKDKHPLKENLDLSILKEIKAKYYVGIFFYVLLGWSAYFTGWWILTKALYVKISFLQMVGAVSIATVISLIPITISGLGTRDAAMIFIFSKLDIATESALSFSLLIFVIEIVIVCFGMFFFFRSFKAERPFKNV